jgi:hypothetical protein
VALVEVVLSFTLDVYRCDDHLGWGFARSKTGWKISRSLEFNERITFNSHGFRGGEREYEKRKGTYRILLLGDSFFAATQVPLQEAFFTIIEQRLNEETRPGQKVEIISAGVDGYGTAQQLLLFREQASKYEPDLVVAEFLVNDIADNFMGSGGRNHYLAARCGRPYFDMQDGEAMLVDTGRPVASTGPLDRILRKSILYSNFVRPPAPDDAELGFVQSEIYDPNPSLAVSRAWNLTEKLLLQLDKEVRSQKIPLVILVVPEVFQIDFTSVGHRRTDSTELPTLRAHARISEFLSRNGLDFIDLRAPLQKSPDRGQRPYFEYDYHWNKTGHDIVAVSVYDWLVDRCHPLGLPISECSNGNRASGVPN